MKDFAIEFDAKTHSFSVDHANVVKDLAKDYEKSLIIKPIQFAVQVAFDKSVSVSDPQEVIDAAYDAAVELADKVRGELDNLQDKILKLKREEDAGNKKASDTADKEVKASKKRLDKLAGEFGADVRVAVEKALTRQTKQKVKARSASRTVVRGLELNEDFFDEAPEADLDPYVGKLAKTLAASGKVLSKLTTEEKGARKDLGVEIDRIQALIEKQRAGKAEFDLKQFYKENGGECRKLETVAVKYVDFIASMKEKIDAVETTLNDFTKLLDDADTPDIRKSLENETKLYGSSLAIVESTLDEKLDAGKRAQRLFKEDYAKGEGWKKLVAELEAMKAAAKSGANLQSSGLALEKLTQA